MSATKLFGLWSLVLGLCLAGCATRPGQPLLIQPVLDALVPADFQGDGEFGHRGHYLGVEVKAKGLRRTESGWTWSALSYRRTLDIPIFSGVPYRNVGWVTLEPPK